MKKMKVKGLLAFSLSMLSVSLFAQTVDEGITMYKFARYESAKKILEPLSASNPMANYYLGLAELGLENNAAAKTIFQKFPDDVANNAGTARVLFAENKGPEAMSMLTKTAAKAKKKDWSPLRYAADAITYSEGGDPNMAVQWYKKAIETERNGDLYMGMGDAYRKMQGGGGNAMSSYEDAETFPATKSIANYKMGNLWYAAKNYDSALVKFNKSSELDDANPLPYKALADAYYRVKKYKTAKEKIEKYLERSDKSITDLIEYANVLYLSQDYPNAISRMSELVAKGEGNKRPYMFRVLGYSQFETKDYPNALLNMNTFFAKIDPKKILSSDYIYLGKILMTDSLKSAEAATAFEKGIAIDTTSDKAPLYKQLGDAFKEAQKYGIAAQYYEKVLATNSPSIEPNDYWWCGAMHYYNKNYESADSLYTLMGEKYPTEPSSFYWRGNVTLAAKDKDYQNGAASEFFTKWLTMVKTDDPAKKKNLIKAYTYLAMVAYNANKKEETRDFATKLQVLDPNDDTAKQLMAALDAMK
jgi:tetratricopeptide (TPR) repeat protein